MVICITLISGQNVNSFNDTSESSARVMVTATDLSSRSVQLSKGFKSIYKVSHVGVRFAELLDRVSDVDPEMRIRFTSPHPKDFPDEVSNNRGLQIDTEKPDNGLCSLTAVQLIMEGEKI